jgi:sulfite reductase (NADPH) flavoprotein alpha-component
LEQWFKARIISLFTAFSRDQSKKIYVQDRIRENAAEIWSLLQRGAHFYVCGDASSMAGQVEAELLALAVKFGNMSQQESVNWLNELSEQHRYERDVWF